MRATGLIAPEYDFGALKVSKKVLNSRPFTQWMCYKHSARQQEILVFQFAKIS